MKAGLYDRDGNLEISWAQLIRDGMVEIEKDCILSETWLCMFNSTLVLPEYITDINLTACSDLAVAKLHIHKNIKSISNVGCIDVGEIIEVDPENLHFSSKNGVLFNKNMTELIKFPYNSPQTKYIIPNGINKIGVFAFLNSQLEEIVFNDDLLNIDEFAFSGANLKCLNLPKSIQQINSNAFRLCTELKELYIPENLTYISNAFAYNKLNKIKVDPNNKNYDSRNDCNAIIETKTNTLIQGCKKTIIPDNIVKLGNECFCGLTIENIRIPHSIKTVGREIFDSCDIKEIVYVGTKKDFEKIKYNNNFFTGNSLDKNTVKYTDTLEYLINCGYNLRKANKFFKENERQKEGR